MGNKQGTAKKGQKPQKRPQWNPISQLLSEHTIEALKNRWDNDQFKLLEERVRRYRKTGINFKQFLKIFPHLSGFPKETKERVFRLFHRSQDETMTNQEFLIGVTLVKKSQDPILIGKMVFFLYSMENKMQEMDNQGYLKFLLQNKSRIKDQNKLKQLKQWWPAKKIITPEEFIPQWRNFQTRLFVLLFEEDYVIEEKNLAQRLKQRKNFGREVGDEVYMVEFRWYMQWKSYMYFKYGVDPKIKDRTSRVNKEEEIYKSNVRFQTNHSIEFKHQSQIHGVSKRPGVIPNYSLIGDEYHELRERMKEFEDYVLVPAWLWDHLHKTYYGHPQIMRLYPQVYCIKVYQVFVDKDAKFIPNKTQHLQLVYNEMRIHELFDHSFLHNAICMHKYPGLENWTQIPNFKDQIGNWVSNCKVFLCFMPKNIKEKFIRNYNVVETEEGRKHVEERIQNYATMLRVPVHGLIRKAFVIKLTEHSIYAEYRNEENSRYQIMFDVDKIRKYNPKEYSDHDSMNSMAGLTDRHGIHSYINAVVQCLIRTPYFGMYMDKLKLNFGEKDKQDEKKQLILWALSKIYTQSKQMNILRMDPFRRAVTRKIPLERQSGHVDANDFLNKLLKVLGQEVKQYREDYERIGKSEKSVRTSSSHTNIKIDQFFLTDAQRIIQCQKCGNKEEKDVHLYTHSISLPAHNQLQIFFYFFPKDKYLDWKPSKYGIDGKKNMEKKQFLQNVYQLVGLPAHRLRIYALKNGEWVHDIVKDDSINQMADYVDLGFKILVYEVIHEKSVQLQVQFRKEKKSSKSFKPYAAPLLLQLEENQTWGEAIDQIVMSIEGKYTDGKMTNSRASSRKSYQGNDDKRSSKNEKTLRPRRKSIMTSRVTQVYSEGMGDGMAESRMRPVSEYMDEPSHLENSRLIEASSYMENSHLENSRLQNSRVEKQQNEIPPEKRASIRKSIVQERILNENDQEIPDVPFEIRIISKKENSQKCFFCRRRFKGHHYKHFMEFAECRGCTFKDKILPISDQSFMSHLDEMIIVVDWDHEKIFEGFEHIEKESCKKCEQLLENRRDDLTFLLNANLNYEQKISESCANQRCNSKQQLKIQHIQNYPNMLIIHIDRFYRNKHGLMKKNNKISYPQQLFHEGQKYELYGVVVHDGQVSRGHYYSYVKVDDYDEWYLCDDTYVRPVKKDRKYHINPDAYLLFYKKSELEPTLLFLNPLIVQ